MQRLSGFDGLRDDKGLEFRHGGGTWACGCRGGFKFFRLGPDQFRGAHECRSSQRELSP